MGPFKCYVTQWRVGGCRLSRKKRYEGVRFNVISVTNGWVGVKFPGKKRYVTLEWPLYQHEGCTDLALWFDALDETAPHKYPRQK